MNNAITNPVNLIIIIIGLFLGLLLGLFLLFNNSAKNKANLYLGTLVLLSLFIFLPAFLFRFDLLERFPHTIGWHKLIPFLIGPLTYFYVRACTQKGFKMRPILWLHFLPFVIEFLWGIPFTLQSGSEKLDYFYDLLYKGNYQKSYLLTFLQVIHAITYFSIAAWLIFQYKKHLSNATSAIDHTFHNWVLVFISIHFLPSLALIWFAYVSFGDYTMAFTLLSFFLFSVAVLIAALVKPELFHAFPHQMPIPNSTEEKTQKYENSNLQEERKEKFLKKLLEHTVAEKPYLSPELTLSELSEQTKIPAHYLSQIINEKLDCNFLDFINSYRVEAAKKLLSEDASKQFTILSIAYDAGFNSKSTFYAAFKKHAGTTPSSFRKQLMTS